MNRIASTVSLLVAVFVTGSAFSADPLVVDVWPGKTARDVGINGQENSRSYLSPLTAGTTKLVTNVTEPTLTIYQPSGEKSTGTAMPICPGLRIPTDTPPILLVHSSDDKISNADPLGRGIAGSSGTVPCYGIFPF